MLSQEDKEEYVLGAWFAVLGCGWKWVRMWRMEHSPGLRLIGWEVSRMMIKSKPGGVPSGPPANSLT